MDLVEKTFDFILFYGSNLKSAFNLFGQHPSWFLSLFGYLCVIEKFFIGKNKKKVKIVNENNLLSHKKQSGLS